MIMEALRDVLGAPPVPRGPWRREARFVSTAALRGTARPAAEAAERLAVRLRALPGVRRVTVQPNGFLVIEIATPGDVVDDILSMCAPGTRGAGDAGPSTQAGRPPRGAGRERDEAGGGPTAGASATRVPRGVRAGVGDGGPPGEPGDITPGEPGDGMVGPWPDFPRTWDNPGFAVRYAYVRAGAVRRWARDLGVPGGAAARSELLDGPFDRDVLRVLAELPSRRESRDPGWAAYLERLAEAYHTAVEHASPIPKGDEPPSEVHAARVRMGEAVRRVLAEGLADLGVEPPGKI